jgi:hypothetical protein
MCFGGDPTDNRKIIPMQADFEFTRGKEIILGVLLILAGLATFFSNWYNAISTGAFRHGAAILTPLIFVGGVMLLVAPYPHKDQPFDGKLAPKSWNVLILIGVIFGFANWYFMNFG